MALHWNGRCSSPCCTRLFGGGSDRAADRWREDYAVAGIDGLAHLYRAMAWLGEELPAKEQDGRTPFAPRCLKDVVEERSFDHRRDLLTRLDLVFMDTTSLYFEGAGGQTLGRHGYSKDRQHGRRHHAHSGNRPVAAVLRHRPRVRGRRQKLSDVLDLSNTSKAVWADSAYRSVEIEMRLKEKGLRSRIHRRGARNRPLSERQKSANTTRSKVRARVEHVFGHQQSSMGGKIVRTIGIARARFKIGMMNLGYNICRLVQLERVGAALA
jgi:IS5 family transposase